MPSYCCSSSDFLQSHYTVLLSSFSLPISCASWCCCSRPYIPQSLQVRLLFSQFSPFVAQIKNICSDPGFLLSAVFAKDLTGCFSHCCIEGGDHRAMLHLHYSWWWEVQTSRLSYPRREAGDVWCLPPVWNLRAVIWFHFAIPSLVLLPSPVTLSVLSFSACWPFLLNFFPRSGELRTQKLKSHLVRTQSLNVLPFKPGVGQHIAIHATLTARDFFLAYFYPSSPFTCIFSKTSPNFFLCWPAE